MGDARRTRCLAASLLTFVGSEAAAFEYEILHEDNQWRVDINFNDDETLTCEARSTSRDGVVVSLYEEQDGSFMLNFHSQEWNFPATYTETTFVVTVDYRQPWDMSGGRQSSSISISPDRTEEALAQFLGEIRTGQNLYLSNAAGSRITTFSLNGSSSSLSALADCAARIRSNAPDDPFATPASDPFR